MTAPVRPPGVPVALAGARNWPSVTTLEPLKLSTEEALRAGPIFGCEIFITASPDNKFAARIAWCGPPDRYPNDDDEEDAPVDDEDAVEEGLHTVYVADPPWQGDCWRDVAITIPKTAVWMNFSGCQHLCCVTFEMPSSIEVIPEACFMMTGIVQFFVPDSVRMIEERCFVGCEYLRRIACSPFSRLETLGDCLFAYRELRSEGRDCVEGSTRACVFIPDTVESLGCECFEGAESVECLPLRRLTKIGDRCFAGTNLKCFELTASVEAIGGGAFNSSGLSIGRFVCAEGCNFSLSGDLLLDKNMICYSLIADVREVYVPDHVRELCDGCFSRANIEIIEFGAKSCLERIGARAFTWITEWDDEEKAGCGAKCYQGCPIHEIHIPDSVREIGDACFSGCDKLRVVTFSSTSRLERIGESAFANRGDFVREGRDGEYANWDWDAVVGCPISEVFLPATLREIGRDCFWNCTQLSRVVFGDSSRLEKVGVDCFGGTPVENELRHMYTKPPPVAGVFKGH